MSNKRVVRHASAWISAISLALVLGFFYLDIGKSSPGDVAAVHAQEPSLLGPQNCAGCHGTSSQSLSLTTACLACHADIGSQLSDRTGFHGTQPDDIRDDCARCHSEHHGHEFRLVNDRSFELAGVSNPASYDHAHVRFGLTGTHSSLACDKCHPFAQAAVLRKGTKRFLGADQSCTSCHDDVHKGSYGPDCASCHGQEHPFPQAAAFEHTHAFALVGSHGSRACMDCHQANSSHSVQALMTAVTDRTRATAVTPQLDEVRACRTCHQSPHNEAFLGAVANVLDLEPDRSCQQCHDAAHATFRGPEATLEKSLHTLAGFALDPPHDRLACERCHSDFGKGKPLADGFLRCYPGRSTDDCRACHGDPHRGQFDSGRFRGSECLTCHDRQRFKPSLFGLAQHANTDFPLVGAHRPVACNKCHTSPDGRAESASGKSDTRVFHGTPRECRACHADPHRGQFDHGPFADRGCVSCHNERSFAPATFTIQQHDQTRFPLTGAHQAVSCDSCHKRPVGQVANLPGRKADWESAPQDDTNHDRLFRGTPTSCQSCHADVHDGAFDKPGLPATFAGQESCARCHGTERFDHLRSEEFDHALWTGYDLEAAHARVQCVACHKRGAVPDARGRTFGRVTGKNCQACHNDPHVGQFGPTRTVDCARCHSVGGSFRELVFDHDAHSAFKLDDVHGKLDCSKCHQRYRLPGGGTAVRYKPLGTKCVDCHDAGDRSGKARRKSQ